MKGQKQQWISQKINIRHPGQLKKLKSMEPFWSYQLKSTANLAILPQNWAKLAKWAVLFSQQLQNGSQDFDVFNYNGYRLFILCENHCNGSQCIETHARAFLTHNILSIGTVLPTVLVLQSFLLHNELNLYLSCYKNFDVPKLQLS